MSEDLELLQLYQNSLLPLLDTAMAELRGVFREVLTAEAFEPTMRPKQLRSIVAKLQRERTRLSSMQDLVGFRLVVPGAVEQETLATLFEVREAWSVVDRRKKPRYGYRAVHLIRKGEIGLIEVQLRTRLQHQWAELSERHE